jgi:hypothetical protein
MKPVREWPIVRTILGKNRAGKKLNKVLPFRGAREVIGSVIRGAADLSPVPNAKDASVREKAEKIYSIARKVRLDQVHGKAEDALLEIHDLLDDGQLNDSAELSPEARKKIRLGSSVGFFSLMGYEVAAVIAGWPSVLEYLLLIMGL